MAGVRADHRGGKCREKESQGAELGERHPHLDKSVKGRLAKESLRVRKK